MSKGKEEFASSQMTVDLNVLLQFIQKYDGSREQLNPFLTNCNNAIDLASSSQKEILFKLILSKLEGRAQAACAIKEFDNWPQLEDFLKVQFGERKHYTHLLSELQECKQGPEETVSQFSLRVETCLAKLITEINISIPTKRKMELAGRVAAMEDLALHTFIMGLNPKLATIVRCRDPENLNSAINFATTEEKILLCSERKATQTQSATNSNNRPRIPNKTMHFRNNTYSFQPARTNTTPLICRYCKFPGHSIENCRKREYNNKRRTDYNQPSTSNYKPQFQRVHFTNDEVDPTNVESHCDDDHYNYDNRDTQKN